jgi:hypothetical protein
MVRSRIAALLVTALAVLAVAGVGTLAARESTTTPPPAAPSASAAATVLPFASPSPAAATLVGAGDIAGCGSDGAARTAALLARIAGTIFTAGDNAYERGTASEFASCFAPTWGRFRDRIRPALGNHEYGVADAAAYFDYFGAAAGERGKGYYSYDLGAWHIAVLNSECVAIGGCGASSPEVVWLRADLAASARECTLAIWHRPRWSSGAEHGSDPAYDAFWRELQRAGAEIVINGHDHEYERFAPQTPDGRRDDAGGIREFVVGTGGRSLYAVNAPIVNSEVLRNDTFGVLQLALRAGGYDWRFVPVDGATFTDSGSGTCH